MGSMGVTRLRLDVARRRGAPDFPFVGKFSTTQARCVPQAAARMASLYESNLSMENCLVALSTTRGEGLSGRDPQSGFGMDRHRGAIE